MQVRHPHLFLGLLISFLIVPASVFAGSIPDWMEHWEFGMNVEEDDGPDYFADLILPLYRHADDQRVVFVEPRLCHTGGEFLINLGGGVRQAVLDQTWLLGANVFYDHDLQDSHYRVGWGFEALSTFAEVRSNVYLGVSRERLVEESAAGNMFEKAVDGVDVEAGIPVPYYSRLKVFGGFNWYNFEMLTFNNRYGWTLRAEYTPVPFVVIDGLLSNDTKSNVDWGMTVALRVPFGGNLQQEKVRSVLALDATMFPTGDARTHLFRLVERHHEIVVERRRETGTMTIQVARGT